MEEEEIQFDPQVERQLKATGSAHHKGEFTTEDKIFSALSYISVLFAVPLILRPDSDDINFHAKQGMVLFGAEVVVWVIFEILNAFVSVLNIFSAVTLLDILGRVAWLVFVVVSAAGIYFAARGRRWIIPILGKIAKRLEV